MAQRLSRTATRILRGVMADRDGDFCQLCSTAQDDLEHPLEIDHVDNNPLNWTGPNLQLLCKPCNVGKRNRYVVSGNSQPPTSSASNRTSNLRTGIPPQLRKRTSNLRAGIPSVPPRNAGGTTSPHTGVPPTPRFERERDRRVQCACDLISDPHYQGEHPKVRKELANYSHGSTEQQANFFFHTDFLEWLYTYIADHQFIPTTEAVDAGAMATGGNVQTIHRYLRPLKSFLGPLLETEDMLGQKVLVFKEGINIRSLVPDIPTRNGARAQNGDLRSPVDAGQPEAAPGSRGPRHSVRDFADSEPPSVEGQSEPPPTMDPRSPGASAEGHADARGLR